MKKFLLAGLATLLVSIPASAGDRTWWFGKNLGRPCPWGCSTVEVVRVKTVYRPAPAWAGPAVGSTIIRAQNVTIGGTQVCPGGVCPTKK